MIDSIRGNVDGVYWFSRSGIYSARIQFSWISTNHKYLWHQTELNGHLKSEATIMSGVGKYVFEETREELVFLPWMKFPLLRWTSAAVSLIIHAAQLSVIRLAFSRFYCFLIAYHRTLSIPSVNHPRFRDDVLFLLITLLSKLPSIEAWFSYREIARNILFLNLDSFIEITHSADRAISFPRWGNNHTTLLTGRRRKSERRVRRAC